MNQHLDYGWTSPRDLATFGDAKKAVLVGRLVEKLDRRDVQASSAPFGFSPSSDCLNSLTIDVDDAQSIEPIRFTQPPFLGVRSQSSHAVLPVCAVLSSRSGDSVRCPQLPTRSHNAAAPPAGLIKRRKPSTASIISCVMSQGSTLASSTLSTRPWKWLDSNSRCQGADLMPCLNRGPP